jgi:tetratricopeptide (TPR) repeat protein
VIASALISVILLIAVPEQTAPQVSVDMVRQLASRGDIEGARKVAEQLVRISPSNGEAWYVLGVARAGVKDIPGAILAYRNAVRNNPGHADAWNNLGDLLRRTGEVKDARQAFEQGRRIAPKDPRLALNMALVEIQLRDFAAALRALDDVEAANGPSTVTDYLRSRTYLENGQVASARTYLERFRLATPQDTEAFAGLARLLLMHGAYGQAAELLLTLKPERRDASTEFTLGQAFYAMDRMEQAADVFGKLASRNPGNALYLTWSGHSQRALGSIAQARAAYESAVRADRSAADALTELASLELDTGNAEAAESLIVRALELAPEDSRSQFVAGQVFFRLQRWTQAIQNLEKIKSGEAEYAPARYMLSRAFQQTGDGSRAQAAMAEFKKLSDSGAATEAPTRRRLK